MNALFDEDIIDGSNKTAFEEEGFSYDSQEKGSYTHVRRKLEDILEEKRLRKELEDFLD